MDGIEITGFETWNDFKQIAKILKVNHKGRLFNKFDGPDASIWYFSVDGIAFGVSFDDMAGIHFQPNNKDDLEKLNSLSKDVIQEMSESNNRKFQ